MTHTASPFRRVRIVQAFRGGLGLGLFLAFALVIAPASALWPSSEAWAVPACSPISSLPCTIGPNLELLSASFKGGGGGGGGGAAITFIADPLNPGLTITPNSPLTNNSGESGSSSVKLQLKALNGFLIEAVNAATDANFTGTGTGTGTVPTPGGNLVLGRPTEGDPTTLSGEISFGPVGSLNETIALTGSGGASGFVTLVSFTYQVSLVALGLYENWKTAKFPRSDRWVGSEGFGGQVASREQLGSKLVFHYLRQGQTDSDSDRRTSVLRLHFANPASITDILAQFKVTKVVVTDCLANSTPSKARPAGFVFATFNDGTSGGPADQTGNIFGGIQAVRLSHYSGTPPPNGKLAVEIFVDRCTDAECNNSVDLAATTIMDPANLAQPLLVQVGKPFTFGARWDPDNDQFLFEVNGGGEVALSYGALTVNPAVQPFGNLFVRHSTANCTAGPTVVETTTELGTVITNPEAIIP